MRLISLMEVAAMIRHTIYFSFLITVMVGVGSCSTLQHPSDSSAGFFTAEGLPSLGYLEHRGRRYEVRDLMDPEYRADSEDDFVRKFNPDAMLADFSPDR
ncbi:MAG: hypothetical protein JSV03_12320 [Planctomycetota bacterium]|nr:MAG: hypothetical protein JSV03_12320 [Planctomycetota bacterium]